jgi:hypothetical protein
MNGGDQPDTVRPLKTAAPRAVIFLRGWERGPECYAYCERMGYRPSVVYDPDGTKYYEVYESLLRGEAEVIVVWSMADLPPRRVPRVEAVELAPPDIPRNRRPRLVRWPKK